MDWEGPRTLCDLCLAQVCCSLDVLCSKRADGSLLLGSRLLFPQEMADQLLKEMALKGTLNDTTIGIFRNHKELRLCRVSIRSCPVSAEAFRLAISPHRLQELDASWVPGDITGAQIISSLASNLQCRSRLQKLSLNGLRLDWASLGDDGVGLSSLKGLRTLNLRSTDLTNAVLEDVCTLPQLESLDISCSVVSELTALLRCRNTLRSLIAHRLRRLDMSPASLLSVLSQLQAVRNLDFSDDHLTVEDDSDDGDVGVLHLLRAGPEVLPSLVSLDVSGRRRITEAAVSTFVETRKNLVFLGLLATGISSCGALSSQKNLKVTGEANENQLCEALRRYRDRECFTREALFHLYNITTDSHKPQPEMLELVLNAMQSHPASLHVHLVATACVFNLTTQDQAEAMSVRLLCSTVTQLLHSMKTFPDHIQVQKNCLLALCSDYILQDIPFDTYLAATLVINWLSSHEDPTLQRMAVAVISILVAKLSTAEIATLGEDVSIMKSYYNVSSIQQKVLGLLNNIAEVEQLQSELMEEDLLEHILSLLQDPQIEMGVRYFAGGILAHLTSRQEAWRLDEELRNTILKQLHVSVAAWTHLDKEMVFYRSFRPFCRLLQTFQPTGVQLWAVWAIHFVCTLNTSHYSSILEREGVTELLKALAAHPNTHSIIRGLSESILHMVERQHSGLLNKQVEAHSS
ncbi:protein zyg-11 homolog isoform X2 [Dunckerocampus dactyliophorus]|uniref:protein zyg-11 homolog isoform X2 n=1 Tax=Dunckerocampus dactyliophorus TaxID=161453 RepID=UPI002406A067|nr:protein zyg-11 homolog isoform X2 [Dunckerocampus dactyliophorus]